MMSPSKKQRNYVVALNQKSKYNYLNKLDRNKGTKPSWETCKLSRRGFTSIVLFEQNEFILGNMKIATTFNDY